MMTKKEIEIEVFERACKLSAYLIKNDAVPQIVVGTKQRGDEIGHPVLAIGKDDDPREVARILRIVARHLDECAAD